MEFGSITRRVAAHYKRRDLDPLPPRHVANVLPPQPQLPRAGAKNRLKMPPARTHKPRCLCHVTAAKDLDRWIARARKKACLCRYRNHSLDDDRQSLRCVAAWRQGCLLHPHRHRKGDGLSLDLSQARTAANNRPDAEAMCWPG